MANVLDNEKRLHVLAQLVNNAGVRNTSDVTGVHRDTIGRFAERVGEGCARLHDRLVRDLSPAFVDMDEQHSWVYRRQQNIPEGIDDALIGEQWTWASICRTSKLTISWAVGKRNAAHADELVGDTRARARDHAADHDGRVRSLRGTHRAPLRLRRAVHPDDQELLGAPEQAPRRARSSPRSAGRTSS